MEIRLSYAEEINQTSFLLKNIGKTDLASVLGGEDKIVLAKQSYQDNAKMPVFDSGSVKTSSGTGKTALLVPVIDAQDVQSLNLKMYGDKVSYGEYPQMVENDVTQICLLDDCYVSGQLPETGRSYTLYEPGGTDKITYPEYEYDGKRYIRIVSSSSHQQGNLSSGWKICPNNHHWIVVEPILWKKDENGNLVATRALLSNVVYYSSSIQEPKHFSDTEVSYFLNRYFKEDILPGKNATQTKTVPSKDQEDLSDDNQVQQKEEQNQTPKEEPVIIPTPKPRKKMTRQERYGISVSSEPMTVTEQINFYVQNRMSFMLHGPSGVGKTARVEQIDPDLTAVPLWNGILPEDVVGKVRYPDGLEKPAEIGSDAGGGEWVAPDWYIELTKKCSNEPDKMHVLFIDEVTNARPTTQSLIFHITLKRSISPSKGKLPDNAVVVLAGNSKEESGAAYNMPEPLFRRMCGHIYLKADVQEWLNWGSQIDKRYPNEERLNIHPLVASFVAAYGKKVFYSAYDEENAPKWALDPRGWSQISDIIYGNHGVIQKELLMSKMGADNARSFVAYASKPPLTIDEILDGTVNSSDIPRSPDEKHALTLSLRHAHVSELKIVRDFVQKNLGAENLDIFDSAWVNGDAEKALQLNSVIKMMRQRTR